MKKPAINFFQRIPNPIAFAQGKKGFYRNEDNPYPDDTWPSKEWERGFNKAYWENEETLK